MKKAFPPAVAASSSDQSIDWLKREKEKLLDQTIANELNRIEKESHVEVEKIKADLRSSGHCIGLVIDRLEKLRYKTLRQCGNAIISSVVDSLSPEEPGTPEQVELICKQIIERTIPFVNGSTKNWLRIADGMLQANGERCYRTVEALEERAKRTEFGVESHVRNKAQYDLRKRLISLLSARPSVPLVNASILKIDSSDVSVISSTIPGDFQKTESKSTLPRNNQRWKTAREIADVVGNSMQTGGELKKKWDSRSGFYPAVRGWVKRQGGSTKVYDPQEIVDKAIAAGDIRMQDIRRINNDFGLKEATVTPKKPKKKK